MIRLLFFVVLVLALGFGFAWLADRPGDLSIVWQGRRIEMTLMTAVTVMVSLIAAVMIVWWLIRTIWQSPRMVSRYFRANKRDRGYQALSTGLLAAGAGDAATARKMNKRTKGLLSADQEPLIHLLDVQAALIEGRNDEARKRFEAMSEDPETRLLGLRGLYLEARRQGAHEAARQYAERAAEQAPQLPWAGAAALAYKTQEGKWDEALRLLEQQRQAGTLEAAEADRKKAVLLTARGRDRLDAEPLRARDDALAALKSAPGFAPAAVVACKALLRNDNLRKAARILESAWKINPHPEIAEAYVHARVGDTSADRLKRAQRLEKIKPLNAQAYDTVARAALEARQFDLAREKAEASARLQPCEGIYLLLADIEEAQTGDEGRVRHWLGQAVRAERDPAWTADGYVSETWEPVSPISGKLDAFEWKVPVEQLSGPQHEAEMSERSFDRAIASLPPVRRTEDDAENGKTVDHDDVAAKSKPSQKKADPAPRSALDDLPDERLAEPSAPSATLVTTAGVVADPVADALAPAANVRDVPRPAPAPIADADAVLDEEAAETSKEKTKTGSTDRGEASKERVKVDLAERVANQKREKQARETGSADADETSGDGDGKPEPAAAPIAAKPATSHDARTDATEKREQDSKSAPESKSKETGETEPEPARDPEEDARARETAFLTHRPDDPGVDADAEPEKPGRFRLF
jgi:HemY protein